MGDPMRVRFSLLKYVALTGVTCLVAVLSAGGIAPRAAAQGYLLEDISITTEVAEDSVAVMKIEYDLPGYPGDTFEVRVLSSGMAIPQDLLSGDVGPETGPGNSHVVYVRGDGAPGGAYDQSSISLVVNPTYRSPRSSEGMAMIPEGPFLVGGFSPSADDSLPSVEFDSALVDSVRHLPSFLIDATEVTNEEFAVFLNSGHRLFYHPNMRIRFLEEEKRFEPRPGYADHPVTYVNWYAAAAFADWAGKRLPTAEEWEKAARGTSRVLGEADGVGAGYPYPWGSEPPDPARANFLGATPGPRPGTGIAGFYDGEVHGDFQTAQSSSPYGLFDMAGNVWEWTATRIVASPIKGASKAGSTLYVVKGGGWRDPAANLLVTSRPAQAPTTRSSDLGFRCARDLEN